MSAKEFFEKYSIEEISKRTKISPLSLEYIKNKEFEKLSKVKFLGFLKIIENEFKVDLDELREEFNEFYNTQKEETKEVVKDEKSNNLFIIIIALVLIGGGIYFYFSQSRDDLKSKNVEYTKINQTKEVEKEIKKVDEVKELKKELNKTDEKILEKNTTSVKEENNNIEKENNNVENKSVKNTQKNNKVEIKEIAQVIIIPQKKLWFRALNLDTNKTKEFLTTNPIILDGKNFYLKLGHGEESIQYKDLNITPNTKKVVRILLKDGNFTYLPRDNRFEK